jgi:hypothetical protein
MALRFNGRKWPLRLVSSIAIAAGLCLAADKPVFQPKPAEQYATKQTSGGITIGAEVYTTDEQTKVPFGKLNPWTHNVLPVLVVIHNASPNAIRVERAQFEYELPDRTKTESTPASDVKYANGVQRPKASIGPLGGIKVGPGKNPLAAPEIEVRAFSAKVIPAGDTASGFVYFQTDVASAGAQLYITGLTDAVTGKDILYFEIPLSGQ